MPAHSRNTFPTQDDIAKRAYERFQERGCVDGYDYDDWLAAEQELLDQHHQHVASDIETVDIEHVELGRPAHIE